MSTMSPPRPSVARIALPIAIWALIIWVLFIVSYKDYLLFHTFVELATIGVAMAIFSIGWNTRHYVRDSLLLAFTVAYLCIGLLDMLHILAFKGMGVFHTTSANLATQFWVEGRMLEAGSYLLFLYLLITRRPMPVAVLLPVYLGMTAVLMALVWPLNIFPVCYVDGTGLTPFKIASEFVICAVFLVSALVFWRYRTRYESRTMLLLIAALVMKIISELFFSYYFQVNSTLNFAGHIARILSFFFLYRALIEGSLRTPYDLLFRDVVQARQAAERALAEQTKVEQARERLLGEVQYRAAELDATIQSIAEGLIIYGKNGEIVTMNPSAEALFGYTPAQQQLPITERLRACHYETPDGLPLTIEQLPVWRAVQGETVKGEVLTFTRADGIRQWVSISAAPICSESGEQIGAVVTLTDIAPLRSLQEQQEVFVHTVSHDLRSPLVVVQLHTQLLMGELTEAGYSSRC